jgi:hypothetical protein
MWRKLVLAVVVMAVNIWMIVYFSDNNNPAPFLPAVDTVSEQKAVRIKTNTNIQADFVRYDSKGR